MGDNDSIGTPIYARRTQGASTRSRAWFPSTRTPEGARQAAEQSGTAAIFLALGYGLHLLLVFVFKVDWIGDKPSQPVLIADAVAISLAVWLSWLSYSNPGPIKAVLILCWVLVEFALKLEAFAAKYPGSFFINVIATLYAINGLRGALALASFRKKAAAASAAQ